MSADHSKTQQDRILWLLEAAWPNWTPAPELARISLQYGRAIHSLRGRGWLIQNRVRIVEGIRHGEFRLGSRPVPSNQELRQRAAASEQEPSAESLFGDLMPDRTFRE